MVAVGIGNSGGRSSWPCRCITHKLKVVFQNGKIEVCCMIVRLVLL